MTYIHLINNIDHVDYYGEEESLRRFWNNIFTFYDINQQNKRISFAEKEARDSLLNFFIENNKISQFDYNNPTMVQFLTSINIITVPNTEDNKVKKLTKFIRYHQEEIYKKKLLNREFKEIPEYFVFLFSLFTKNRSKSTIKEKLLATLAGDMIDYLLKNDVKKLHLITSFYGDLENANINSSYMEKIFTQFKDTELKNNVISGFLAKYIEQSTLYVHKKIEVNNLIEKELFNYLFLEKKHWSKLPLLDQGFLFSKVYCLHQSTFTEDENSVFKKIFIEYIDKVTKYISTDQKPAITEIFNSQINLPLLILEYSPSSLATILGEVSYLNHVEDNFRSVVYQKTEDSNIDLEFLDDSESFLFKTLFVNMMIYSDSHYHDHLAEIYGPQITDMSLLEAGYINGRVKSVQETMEKTYNALSNIADYAHKNNNLHSSEKTSTEESLFTAVLWVHLYHHKTTVEDYEKFLLLSLLNRQSGYTLTNDFYRSKISNNSFQEWIEYCVEEILQAPDDVLHSMGDSFEKLRTLIQQSEVRNEKSFANNLHFIFSRLDKPDYAIIDQVCNRIEDKILNISIPKNNHTNKIPKF